jgi:hypothetical protein
VRNQETQSLYRVTVKEELLEQLRRIGTKDVVPHSNVTAESDNPLNVATGVGGVVLVGEEGASLNRTNTGGPSSAAQGIGGGAQDRTAGILSSVKSQLSDEKELDDTNGEAVPASVVPSSSSALGSTK